jgi:hypothetical protein
LKFIRKALLPAVIAAGFLGFLGTLSPSVPTVSAAVDDICSVTGPSHIPVGVKTNYTAVVDGSPDGEISVDLNDQVGDTEITSLNGTNIAKTDFLHDVDLLNAGNVCNTSDSALRDATVKANYTAILNYLLAAIDRGESCSAIPPSNTPIACDTNAFPNHNNSNDLNPGAPLHSWQDNDIDCGLVSVLGATCSISPAAIQAAAQSLAESQADNGLLSDSASACATAAAKAEKAVINNWGSGYSATSEYVGGQLEDFLVNRPTPCGASNTQPGPAPASKYEALPGTATPDGDDGTITVDVTCLKPGTFDLSFSTFSGKAKNITVICGDDVVTADPFAVPTSVEINPSIANVAHSLVWVSLKGRDGLASAPGTEVTITSDRCSVETSAVDTEDEFEAAESLFRGINPLAPSTALAVEQSVFATTAPDGASRQQDEVLSFGVTSGASTDFTERTIAAAILHCDPIHAPNVTPGPANVTFVVTRGDLDNGLNADNDDLFVKTTVTVVGPPAANGVTVTAAPASLACGEKATITATINDSIGQPVSDHTLVEAVTNAGGVLAGTGAVAGQAGLVSPVSSTVAETFGGKVTFYLLTSTAHVGKYEVVLTTGGGGGVTGQLTNGGNTTNLLGGLFTTQPISVQVTVECTVPAAPVVVAPTTPSTSGPATGQGIRPPSTGDAGLVSTDSSTWVAGAAFAVVAALVVAGFSVKLVRED